MEVDPAQKVTEGNSVDVTPTQKNMGKAATYYQDLAEPYEELFDRQDNKERLEQARRELHNNPREQARRERERSKSDQKQASRDIGEIRRSTPGKFYGRMTWQAMARNLEAVDEVAQENPSTPQELETERDLLLTKNFERYYKTGAIMSLARGFLDVLPDYFVATGFGAIEGARFDERLESADDSEAEINFQYGLKEQASNLTTSYDSEKIAELESEAVMAAIARGAFIYEHSYGGTEVDFALPVDNPDLPKFLYKHVGAMEDLRKLSYRGLNNIIKRVADVCTNKEDTEFARFILEAGRKQFDFYFQNFGYANHMEEFRDYFYGIAEKADTAYGDVLKTYLGDQAEEGVAPELMEEPVEESVPEITQKEYNERLRIASVGKIELDELKKLLTEHWHLTGHDILRETSEAIRGLGESTLLKRGEVPGYAQLKIARFLQEADLIKTLDPFAEFYLEGFIKAGGDPVLPDYPYLVARFGNRDLEENCVYAESTTPIGSFYTWHGKANGDAWREIFRKSPAEARASDGVKSFRHGKREHLQGSIERLYDRAHKEVPLPTLRKLEVGADNGDKKAVSNPTDSIHAENFAESKGA